APWHPEPGYVVLPAESLIVGSKAQLLTRELDGQRWVALEITVQNPRGIALVLSAPSDVTNPSTFAFDIRGPLGGLSTGEISTDSSTIYFGANATKRWHYEFRVAMDLSYDHIPIGRHFIRGGYANNWATWDTVDV